MGLLDRFSNPIWHKISKLDRNRQFSLAVVICSYDYLRQQVEEQLVSPLKSFLREGGGAATVGNVSLTTELTAQLVDEALLGMLRCCSCPPADPSGRVPSTIVQGLPELWGTFVLADMNHHLDRSSPNVLEETHYSKDPDEARTQVLVRWMEILRVASPSFANGLISSGFATGWRDLVHVFISGMLKGFSRVSQEQFLSKARDTAAEIPPHRARLLEHFIKLAASPSANGKFAATVRPAQFPARERPPADTPTHGMPEAKPAARQTVPTETPCVQPLRPDEHVELDADGRAILKAGPSAGLLEFIRQTAQVFRRDLKHGELTVFETWLGVRGGRWTQAHEDAFVRGFERFFYEGLTEDKNFHVVQQAVRQEYPVLRGSAIDIPFPPEVRAAYSRLVGGVMR